MLILTFQGWHTKLHSCNFIMWITDYIYFIHWLMRPMSFSSFKFRRKFQSVCFFLCIFYSLVQWEYKGVVNRMLHWRKCFVPVRMDIIYNDITHTDGFKSIFFVRLKNVFIELPRPIKWSCCAKERKTTSLNLFKVYALGHTAHTIHTMSCL